MGKAERRTEPLAALDAVALVGRDRSGTARARPSQVRSDRRLRAHFDRALSAVFASVGAFATSVAGFVSPFCLVAGFTSLPHRQQ